ncbi:MAG: ATP-binding protein [Pseudomonadota bacterium]
MTDRALLERIAAALERIAPPPAAPVNPSASAYVWGEQGLAAATNFAPLPIEQLTGIDAQRDAMLENNRRLAAGHAAHDILLWGARGSGKSALVKSCIATLQAEGAGVALIEIAPDRISELPLLFAAIADWPRAVIVFIDDLAFEGQDQSTRLLRSVLEGGANARPADVRIYVTSNRRHIVARDMAEQAGAINPRDAVDDSLALADRFGLSLGFHVCDQATYLAMIAVYAKSHGFAYDPADALTWAAQRGARSGRVAWHYAVECAGHLGRKI